MSVGVSHSHVHTLPFCASNLPFSERNWVICRDVDGSRDYHTEWRKSEREKQISYINAYMWNLEKWYRWTGLQGRNRDTDVENKCMDPKGGKAAAGVGGGGMNWEIGTDMYTLMCINWMTNKNLLYKKINKIKFKKTQKTKNISICTDSTWGSKMKAQPGVQSGACS